MARARNIKPSFFTNDELADIDPLGRLLFMGLWTIADFKGDVIWRERRIKAQVLPYDNCDVKQLSISLDKLGFIRFYSAKGEIYINITNFCKHQNPHKNEKLKGSDIPVYNEESRQLIDFNTITINLDKNGTNPDLNGTARADSFNPLPDSCSLIPVPLNPIPQKEIATNRFNEFWDLYQKKSDRTKCEKKFVRLNPKQVDKIFEVVRDYVVSTPDAQYRKNPLTWINGECWNDEITTSSNTQGYSKVTQQNLIEAEKWERSFDQ